MTGFQSDEMKLSKLKLFIMWW